MNNLFLNNKLNFKTNTTLKYEKKVLLSEWKYSNAKPYRNSNILLYFLI